MARPFRLLAWLRWLSAGETLAGAPPGPPEAPPPESGLRRFFLGADALPDNLDAPAADSSATARPPFWRWLLAPERLPRTGAHEPPRAEP